MLQYEQSLRKRKLKFEAMKHRAKLGARGLRYEQDLVLLLASPRYGKQVP